MGYGIRPNGLCENYKVIRTKKQPCKSHNIVQTLLHAWPLIQKSLRPTLLRRLDYFDEDGDFSALVLAVRTVLEAKKAHSI